MFEMNKDITAYRIKIYHFILKFVKNPFLADDLTQDVMLKIWERRAKISTLEEIDAYIMRMSKNHVIDHFKKLAKEKHYQEEIWLRMQKTENNITAGIITKEMEDQLNTILKNLPPRQQEIYTLNKEKGLSLIEISEMLDIAPNTVKNHLNRALKVIQTKIKSEITTIIILNTMTTLPMFA